MPDDPLFAVFVLVAGASILAVIGWILGQLIRVVIEALNVGQ